MVRPVGAETAWLAQRLSPRSAASIATLGQLREIDAFAPFPALVWLRPGRGANPMRERS
jgi:hypothetical protein